MLIERITAGPFTAVVCREASDATPRGCMVVFDGIHPGTANPCLFLTESTAESLTKLLKQARAQWDGTNQGPEGDASIETKASPK